VEHQRRLTPADEPLVGNDAARGAPVVDVVVLSSDEKLLAILRDASSAHHALWHATSPDAAIELLVGGHCGILIADLAVLRNDTLQLLERLQTQFPELIILATGRGEEEVAVASAISSGRIYRFLHKPVSAARANLFLTTATRRYGELREVHALAMATMRMNARRPPPSKLRWGVAAAAVIGAACLWWGVDRKSERVVNSAAQSPTETYLSRAQAAFKAGRLSGQDSDNALALYRAALESSPDSDEARSGIDRVMTALDKRVVAALGESNLAAATAALNELQHAHPAHPHLARLNQQLQALSTRSAVATRSIPAVTASKPTSLSAVTAISAEPRSIAKAPIISPVAIGPAATVPVVQVTTRPAPPPLTPQIDRAQARLAASQLIAPVDDSAADYLRRARDTGEDETRLKIAATDLGARLLEQAHQALLLGKLEQSAKDYAAAESLDKEFELTLPDLQSVGAQLKQAQFAAAQEPAIVTHMEPAIASEAKSADASAVAEPAVATPEFTGSPTTRQ
jgi:hypothetical protein